VWLKCRSIAYNHRLVDSVQGVGSTLSSNLTNAAVNSSSEFTSLDSNGFSITQGAGYEFNNNAVPYVAWAWDAGGAGSSNTDGTITSTVSANPTAGFSIGTYTADGSNANRTVGHGLGVAPEFIIVKNRDTTGRHWLIWHKGFNDNDKALLFTDAAVADNRFGPSAPTSTVFGLYGGQGNYNSDDHVFYAFAGVEGYSKFGSYTGNGSPTDGPFIATSFAPAMVIIKNISTNSNWIIRDSARSPYNQVQPSLYPNLPNSEINNFPMDFLANGFKIRDDNGVFNTSGNNYIFMCFAENPFGGDGVSPATAR
jgi:hypothetical protein